MEREAEREGEREEEEDLEEMKRGQEMEEV